MQYVKKHAVHEKAPMSQCWKETGKNPIKTGWADTNKGTSECPNIGSRSVAKEYNTGPRPDLSSATSPLEGVKLVISKAASCKQKGQCSWCLTCEERTPMRWRGAESTSSFGKETEEDQAVGSVGCRERACMSPVTLLKTGNASLEASWRGLACAGDTCLCSEELRGISASVHGDDVTIQASREDAEWPIRKFKERIEITTQMIGEAADLDKHLQILNRTVRWSSRGLWIEAHPRLLKEVIKALGLEVASPAPTPGVAAKGRPGSKTTKTAPTPNWGMRRPPCSVRSWRGRTSCPNTGPTLRSPP